MAKSVCCILPLKGLIAWEVCSLLWQLDEASFVSSAKGTCLNSCVTYDYVEVVHLMKGTGCIGCTKMLVNSSRSVVENIHNLGSTSSV